MSVTEESNTPLKVSMNHNKPKSAAPGSVTQESKLMVKHSIVYGLGNVLNRVVGFVMIPVYTRFLVPAEYGTLELLSLTTEILGMLISMRLAGAMYRFYFEYDALQDRNEVISTAIISFGLLGIVGLSMAATGSGFLAEKVLDSRGYSYYFIISFTTLWFNTMVGMGFYYLQILKKSVLYISLSAVKLAIALGFNIYFIVYAQKGVLGILYGNLIAAVSLFAILVIPMLFRVGVRFSSAKIRDMLAYSLPMVPGSIANFLVLVSDRYIVKVFGSLADTGIYSLSYKFSVVPHTFITVPFFQIWSVRRFELMKDGRAEVLMGRVITYFLFLITYVGLAISVLAKDVIHIMADSKYWEAYRYVPILILSYLVFSLFNHFVFNIFAAKKTKYISYIDIGNGIVNVLLNIVLIRSFGIYGAAVATLISYSLRIGALYLVSSSLNKVYFEFGRAGKILTAAIAIFGVCALVQAASPYLGICVKSVILLFFPVLLYFLQFFSKDELHKLNRIVSQRSLKSVWQ